MIKTNSAITKGPLFSNMLLFTLPIILSRLLQVAYNMADNIVVGNFSGDPLALAAVGSTGTLTSFIVSFLAGFATGSGAIIARYYGAKDNKNLIDSIHTGAAISIIGGISFGALAFLFAEPLLDFMGTKPEVASQALLYFRIICLGIPASSIYNFCAAVMRSLGDSKRPLYVLASTGIVNVILNLVFIICFRMTVDGVALATVIAQYLSAAAVFIMLVRQKEDACRIRIRLIGIRGDVLPSILKIAIPASLQSSVIEMSNILIQSSVNQLSVDEVSAKSIAANIDGLLWVVVDSFSHTAVTYVAQNYGANNFARIKKVIFYNLLQVAVIGFAVGQILLFFGRELVGIYMDPAATNRGAVIEYSLGVMKVVLNTYFMGGVMNSLSGILRGLGNSLLPMIIVFGGVGIRMIWLVMFFPIDIFHSLTGIYLSYPISYIICIAALSIALIIEWRKKKKALLGEKPLHTLLMK